MKKYIILLLSLTFAGISYASPRSGEEALAIARKFVAESGVFRLTTTTSLSLSSYNAASMRKAKSVSVDTTPAYYLVNIEGGKGYVVVSGDDRFKSILGYSMDGNVSSENVLPDGLKYWLGFLASEMENAKEQGYTASKVAAVKSAYSESVEPLVTTKWNQLSPYNNMIPMYATGCVATGTAQVMNYWKYPTRGIGSHTNSYHSSYSADFGSTVYDWANMKNEYGGKYDTKAQVDAVATLMYHLGVATDMQWSADNSGTPNIFAAYALINYFGYNKNLYVEYRDFMSQGAWKALVLEELYAGRPLCYAGMTDEDKGAGHFFILDGYDASNGLFHFNWGWGGFCDGYFDLSALEPGGQGQAGALTGSYNYEQQMIVNLQPTEIGEYVAHFDAQKIAPSSKAQSKSNVVFRTTSFSNHSVAFKGTIGVALYDESGDFVDYVASRQNFPGGLNSGYTYTGDVEFGVSMQSVPAGTYTCCLAVKADNNGKVYPVRARYGTSTYYVAKVSSSNVTFSNVEGEYYIEDVDAPAVANVKEPNTAYENVKATFSVKVKNTGTMAFYDEVGVIIRKNSRDGSPQVIVAPCSLAPGEEKTVSVSANITKTPAEYELLACYGDDGEYIALDNVVKLTVKEESANLVLASKVANAKNDIYKLDGVRVPAGVKPAKGVHVVNGKLRVIK